MHLPDDRNLGLGSGPVGKGSTLPDPCHVHRWNEVGDVDMVAWRGDRDERNWPQRIKRGGLWPWTAIEVRASDEDWQRTQREFA